MIQSAVRVVLAAPIPMDFSAKLVFPGIRREDLQGFKQCDVRGCSCCTHTSGEEEHVN